MFLQSYHQNIAEEQMKTTPIVLKSSRRVQTTVDSDYNLSAKTMSILFKEKEDPSSIYASLDPLRKRLFQSRLKTEQHSRVHLDAETVQREYRRKMLEYLDSKFAEAAGNKIKGKARLVNGEGISKESLNRRGLRSIFKQYVQILKEQNIKTMSQYWLGTVLKKLGFISNILQARELISTIWELLGKPGWLQLFVFVTQLYFHHKAHTKTFQKQLNSHQELLESLFDLLQQEGYQFSRKFITTVYDRSSTALEKLGESNRLGMLSNRQSRATCSSWSRSISREKG